MKIALCKSADSVEEISKKERYIWERKIDGIRALLIDGKLYNRDGDHIGKDITNKFPEIKPPKGVALDGEIDNGNGVGSMTGRVNTVDEFKIEMKAKANPATYYAFDLMAEESTDYRRKALLERREVLDSKDFRCPHLEILPYYENGKKLWRKAQERGWEGIVGKRTDKPYPEGRSNDAWLKIKNFDTEIFDVLDYRYTDDGGFVILIPTPDGEQKIVVNEKKEQEKIKNADLDELKAEIRFLEKTDSGRLRHISYQRLIVCECSLFGGYIWEPVSRAT